MSHADWCQGGSGHDNDCGTATELARLRAFAGMVREEFSCTLESEPLPLPDDHVDDCWSCAAAQALERAG